MLWVFPYLQTLFTHLHKEAPSGFSKCTVSQLVSADCEAWKCVIRDNVKPRRDAQGVKPLDDALLRALQSYEVSFALIPLPTKASQKIPAESAVPKALQLQFFVFSERHDFCEIERKTPSPERFQYLEGGAGRHLQVRFLVLDDKPAGLNLNHLII